MGIAIFLEPTLFSSPENDVFNKFQDHGVYSRVCPLNHYTTVAWRWHQLDWRGLPRVILRTDSSCHADKKILEEIQMKMLVLVRHGSCGPDGRLDEIGYGQAVALATRIKEMVEREGHSSISMLCSTAPRALDSADVMGHVLGRMLIAREDHPAFWADDEHSHDFREGLSLIERAGENADVVIVVTHLDYANYFASFMARERGWESHLPNFSVRYGEAVVVNYRTQSAALMRGGEWDLD